MSRFNLSLDDLAVSTFVAMTPDDLAALRGGNLDGDREKTVRSSTNTKFTKICDCCCSHGSCC